MEIRIWQVRMERNLTLHQLADLTGISKSTLNYLENGVRVPNIMQLEILARALDIRIQDIIKSDYL